MTRGEWKVKALVECKEYLVTNLSYPNCDPALILRHLLPMWNKLEEKGLVIKGMTFEHFSHEAHHKYMEYEMRRIMGI